MSVRGPLTPPHDALQQPGMAASAEPSDTEPAAAEPAAEIAAAAPVAEPAVHEPAFPLFLSNLLHPSTSTKSPSTSTKRR